MHKIVLFLAIIHSAFALPQRGPPPGDHWYVHESSRFDYPPPPPDGPYGMRGPPGWGPPPTRGGPQPHMGGGQGKNYHRGVPPEHDFEGPGGPPSDGSGRGRRPPPSQDDERFERERRPSDQYDNSQEGAINSFGDRSSVPNKQKSGNKLKGLAENVLQNILEVFDGSDKSEPSAEIATVPSKDPALRVNPLSNTQGQSASVVQSTATPKKSSHLFQAAAVVPERAVIYYQNDSDPLESLLQRALENISDIDSVFKVNFPSDENGKAELVPISLNNIKTQPFPSEASQANIINRKDVIKDDENKSSHVRERYVDTDKDKRNSYDEYNRHQEPEEDSKSDHHFHSEHHHRPPPPPWDHPPPPWDHPPPPWHHHPPPPPPWGGRPPPPPPPPWDRSREDWRSDEWDHNYDNWDDRRSRHGPPPPPPPDERDRHHRPPPPPPDDWDRHHRPPPPPPDDWDRHHRPPPPPPDYWDRYHRPPPPPPDDWDRHHRPPPPPPPRDDYERRRDPPPVQHGSHKRPSHDRDPPPHDRGPPPHDRGPPPHDRGPPPHDHGPPSNDRGSPSNRKATPPSRGSFNDYPTNVKNKDNYSETPKSALKKNTSNVSISDEDLFRIFNKNANNNIDTDVIDIRNPQKGVALSASSDSAITHPKPSKANGIYQFQAAAVKPED